MMLKTNLCSGVKDDTLVVLRFIDNMNQLHLQTLEVELILNDLLFGIYHTVLIRDFIVFQNQQKSPL